jgi:phosphatidate cytidylyltransferase
VANDTFAYFCGMLFGKRIFGPFLQLSPNKTWEGFIGGLLCTLLYAVLSVKVWGSIAWLRCGFHELQLQREVCFSDVLFVNNADQWSPMQRHAIFFGLFASLVAPFGGFFASAIKRAFKVKDFDSFIPGHGGVTDRMDCQFIMSFFSYIYYSTFIATLHLKLPLNQLLSSVEMLDQHQLEQVARFVFDRLNNQQVKTQLCGGGVI